MDVFFCWIAVLYISLHLLVSSEQICQNTYIFCTFILDFGTGPPVKKEHPPAKASEAKGVLYHTQTCAVGLHGS